MSIVLPKLGHRTCWLALLCFGAVPLTPSDRDPASDTRVAVETTPGDQPVAGGRNPAVGGGTSEGDPGSGLNLAGSTPAASRPADPDSPLTAGSSSASLTGSFPKASFTLLPGDIFLTQDGSTPGIVRVDPTTGIAVTAVSDPALSGISGIAIDASGSVLVTILNPPELRSVDPTTGNVSSLRLFDENFFSNASDVAVEDDGNILVVTEGVDGPPPTVIRYDPVGDVVMVATDGLADLPAEFIGGIAIEADGNIIFSLPFKQEIRRIDRITKNDTVLASGGNLSNPAGLAIAANGDIIVADPGAGAIISIDPVIGAQTVISTGGLLTDPFDVATEGDGAILVADGQLSAMASIVRLAAGTFTQSVLTTPIDNMQRLEVVPCLPSVTNVTPATIPAGDAATPITVDGSCFNTTSVISFDGTTLVTMFVSATSLQATVPAAEISAAGSFNVLVTNTYPAAAASGPFPVSVADPSITSLTPPSVCAGDPAFLNLGVNGANFAAGATVNWDAAQIGAAFVNSTLLNADPQSLHNAFGIPTITVVNNPGGVTSPGFSFSVVGPSNSGLNPLSTIVGGPSFPLMVMGGCFVTGSTVLFNGTPVATVVDSVAQVTATIPAALIASTGTVPVQVMNPGGALSASGNFDINNPAPTLTSLGQNSATAGDQGFTLTLTGGSFVAGSTVQFDGVPQVTTFVNGTTLDAAVPAAQLAAAGTFNVTVFNAAPGGGTSAPLQFTVNNPAPTLTSLGQNSATAGDQGFTLTLTGGSFVAGSTVQFDGVPQATTFVNGTTLDAAVPAAQLAAAGTFNVTVFNAAPGGGTSAPLQFTVNNPAPTLTSLGQDSATAGDQGFTLTLTGGSFVAGSTVQFDGVPQATTFVNGTTLDAAVPAAQLAAAGTFNVTVFNAAPGGGTSAPLQFTVNNPAPTLTSLGQNSATAGDQGFTLTLTGGSFVAGSTVQFDGVPQVTTFVNGTTLDAAVPAAQLAAAGTFNVTVFNAAPGGGTSAPLQFTVNNPAPTLTSLGQNSATAGDPGFTLTLTGGGFFAGSTVQFDGVPQATTFVNGTTLTAAVPAAQLAAAGTFNVTVFNAAPGGGTSAPLQFTVNNRPPIANAGADQNVSTGDSARVQVTLDGSGSSDPDGDPLTFTWTGSFGTLSGMIVNPVLDPGTHTVTLTVADGKGGADTDTVQISVSDGRPPKIIVSPSSLTFTLEETSAPPAASASLVPARPVDAETASKPFRLTVERGPVDFRILPGNSWVRADPDVGQLIDGVGQRILAVVDPAGLPAGTYTAPLFIRTGARIAARLNVTLVITPGSAPRELTVTTESPLPNGAVGSPYNGMLSATGERPPFSWSTAGGALPPGLVLNPATGAIGGTPAAPGVFSWVAIVTDAEGLSAAKAFSIQIAADPSQEPRLGVRPGRLLLSPTKPPGIFLCSTISGRNPNGADFERRRRTHKLPNRLDEAVGKPMALGLSAQRGVAAGRAHSLDRQGRPRGVCSRDVPGGHSVLESCRR